MSVLHPSTREAKAEQQRKKIIDAAVVLFQRHGLNAVGVRDITETAGVSTGTFYHYFASKQNVVNEVYGMIRPDFSAVLEQAAKEDSPSQALKSFITGFLSQQVLDDGLEFTHHRVFVVQQHSRKSEALYQGCLHLVELALQKGELVSAASAEQVLDYLLTVHRAVVYEWCIAMGGFDLLQAMKPAMECAFRAFAPVFEIK